MNTDFRALLWTRVEETAEMQAVSRVRSGAGVEPAQRGAATPHRFLKGLSRKVQLRTEAGFRPRFSPSRYGEVPETGTKFGTESSTSGRQCVARSRGPDPSLPCAPIGNRSQSGATVSLVFASLAAGRFAADCHQLQPRGSIKASSRRRLGPGPTPPPQTVYSGV
jgi:hypothetical protein